MLYKTDLQKSTVNLPGFFSIGFKCPQYVSVTRKVHLYLQNFCYSPFPVCGNGLYTGLARRKYFLRRRFPDLFSDAVVSFADMAVFQDCDCSSTPQGEQMVKTTILQLALQTYYSRRVFGASTRSAVSRSRRPESGPGLPLCFCSSVLRCPFIEKRTSFTSFDPLCCFLAPLLLLGQCSARLCPYRLGFSGLA